MKKFNLDTTTTVTKKVIVRKVWTRKDKDFINIGVGAFEIGGFKVPVKGDYFINQCAKNNENGDIMLSGGGMKGTRQIVRPLDAAIELG